MNVVTPAPVVPWGVQMPLSRRSMRKPFSFWLVSFQCKSIRVGEIEVTVKLVGGQGTVDPAALSLGEIESPLLL